MESCSNQKSVKHIKINVIFEILPSALCLDDSFACSWHYLNQLHEVVTTGVCCQKLICGISILLNAFEPISSVVTR
jgi:hypothetical protein